MIAAHIVKTGKARHTLRLTTAALMRIEDAAGMAFFDLIGVPSSEAEMQSGRGLKRAKIRDILLILGAAMNDGAGADEAEALKLYDALGYTRATVELGEIIARSFGRDEADPEAGDAEGNPPAA